MDLLVGYRRRVSLFGRKTILNLQLNVCNLLNYDDFKVTATLRNGMNCEYVRATPRQFLFSSALSL